MLLIGESLNVISKKIGKAFKERDKGPIQEEAVFQKEAGMDYIDINLGPAKKDGHELMPWVVEMVQEVVDDVPLVLDTSNIDAIAAALPVCKLTPIINSIMARPERYEKMVPLAVEHNADFVALMWGPDGLPRDENERAALCVELLYFANEAGIPNEKIWVDGIVTPVNIQQPQAISLMNFQGMIPDMCPGARSTCGLSNISNGPPDHLRPILNQTYMVMLQKYGMESVISDPRDTMLTDIAKGKRQDIVDVIYAVMDGNAPDMGGLTKELQDYVKTTKVILGESLYSDSWLEI
ncbi:dihydropteroate synthase [Desulfatibacillum aliphaticivorans]|uniref:Methyltransferase (Vitamin-B12 dependent methionine synthase MetH (5-methyltetrahydrofolate--homocysteine methyltransferase)) n=1 Tax=Desulfatibacillum aliphaticivorans TaxID=218208 RepID=B8FJW0_DESAL|nr:dihydropteroate synthase [Desulfatibacillum aliphaticivorans]ACL02388.1 Methyltransferase (vitamin-B12 dependent methionine synthase MetH (5-methyltetrahydrofolate--homocysteine methyltransferase) [Desulfatibacillum aliphaticivorans]